MFLSFIVGVMADPLLRRLANYDWLSSRYLFANSKAYENLGVLWYRKLLLATPLRSFNTMIHLSNDRSLVSLQRTRQYMASAEIGHWVALAAMLGLTVVAWWLRGPKIGIAHLFFNTVGNLYPCLLQQYNKRRLCQLIAALEKRRT